MNNKNGFPYLTQSDSRWANEVMTHPEWQAKPDTIKQYFCLNTSFLNCFNDYYKKQLTPSQLNKQLIVADGYEYLKAKRKYKSLDEVKKNCLGRESYVVYETICNILNIRTIDRDYKGLLNVEYPSTYYIIKVPYQSTGHYCNIISDDKKYFDVYDGKIKTPNQVLKIIKITF